MKRFAIMAVTVLACSVASYAGVDTAVCEADGDGAITAYTVNWVGADQQLNMTCDQYSAPGHMVGHFTTLTVEDPTVTMWTSVDNETAPPFAWSSYEVSITMDRSFTLSNVQVLNAPASWGYSITQDPTLSGSDYVATMLFSGSPTDVIGFGDNLTFKYKLAFSGATRYNFTQTMNPIPEPGTMVLIAIGGIGVLLRRRRKA